MLCRNTFNIIINKAIHIHTHIQQFFAYNMCLIVCPLVLSKKFCMHIWYVPIWQARLKVYNMDLIQDFGICLWSAEVICVASRKYCDVVAIKNILNLTQITFCCFHFNIDEVSRFSVLSFVYYGCKCLFNVEIESNYCFSRYLSATLQQHRLPF